MSIKKLFDSNKPQAVLKSTSLEEEVVKNAPELESADNVREQIKRINRFIPQVDYRDPNSFVTYGSAQSYYEDAVNRITSKYPYDGSEEEVTEYLNESNYLDLHVLENEHPRTTGYVIFGDDDGGSATPAGNFGNPDYKNYITVFGGPNAITGGMTTGSFHSQFTGSNYYDADIYQTEETLALSRVGTRTSNLLYNLPTNGLTVEFWNTHTVPASVFANGGSECLFDLWNGQISSSAGYGRLTVFASGTAGSHSIYVNAYSGTVGVQNLEIMASPTYNTNSWKHYAFAFSSGSSGLHVKSYLDGALQMTASSTVALNEVTGAIRARIGALLTNPSGTSVGTDMAGYGKTTAVGYDEFRYWKATRTEKEIQENYWTHVRGGTNKEIANAELGVYFKFNEGVTADATLDQTALDYSGRVSNGTIYGYGTSTTQYITRNTGSAIVSASAANSEFRDPIIYTNHPDVVSTFNRLSTTGSVHDYENQASLRDSLPAWLIEEDEEQGSSDVKKLTQILGSYFDTLNLQIKSLPDLTDTTYVSSSNKPIPFARNLLSSRGLSVPEIFVDADILERFANRSADEEYSMDINEVKNLIYKNIYNNLTHIYKSKGTEKAFRNLIHCYGIGDNIVRFNAYGSNTTFNIESTRQATSVRKNYVDFNHPDRFGGVVYQNSSSANVETSNITYFSASTPPGNAYAQTAELEVIFPRKFEYSNSQYFDTPFITSSIFGMVAAPTDPSDFTAVFPPPDGAANLTVYAVRTHKNSKDAHFALSGGTGFEQGPLTSSIYTNVYDNQKWNFAIRVKSKNWPYTTGSAATGDSSVNDHDVSLVGYNVESGVVRSQFVLSTSSAGATVGPSGNKRYYVGAQRTNLSGALVNETDVLASSLRVYTTHLDTDVIRSHAMDPQNVGTRNPNRNFVFYNDSTNAGLNPAIGQSIPESVSLALNWDYTQVTGTDATGQFDVQDASSGSLSLAARYPAENVLANVNKQFAGRAYFPGATNSTAVISKQFVQSSQQRLPEVINTDDAVNALSRDDELYPRDAAANQMYFAFEKSMYGVVSQEMVNLFSSVVAFNDLIGEVVNKYRSEYKSMRLLRELFFEKMQNNPDLDKFIDYYKWIDASLSLFLQQLVPASADVSDEIRTMVEDHILTRSKYQHQYPHLDYKGNQRWGGDEAKLEARAFGVNQLDYNWQYGHAPISNSQTEHSTWWKNRAERDNTSFNTAALIDSARQTLNDIILSFNSASVDNLNTTTGTSYSGSVYAVRRFARPVKLGAAISPDIGGGYNYPRGLKPDAIIPALPKNESVQNVRIDKSANPDVASAELRPVMKQEKRPVPSVFAGSATNVAEPLGGSKYLTPFVAYSSSVSPAGGYGQGWQTDNAGAGTAGPDAETGIEFAGYHNDSYGDNYEVPMQGPFTSQHVGGHRHRHTDLNTGSSPSTRANRAEAWHLEEPSTRTTFVAADSSVVSGISTRPNYRRDEIAKRPVNIKNIKHRTGSLGTIAMGNFSKRYEIISTTGRLTNNAAFVKAEGTGSFTVVGPPADVMGYIDHVTDYAKPTRVRTEHVIVNRFSAPGGPETSGDNQGGPGLDFEAAEMSPYNSLNYRNTTVRNPLGTLLKEHSVQFGLRSGSSVSALDYSTNITASFHKVNRNPLHRVLTGSIGSPATGTIFDNYYVQHMIPRSDTQYAWLTASYTSLTQPIVGYLPYDGYVSSSSGLISAINFVSASDLNSAVAGQQDFVGMNSIIINTITASSQTQGWELNSSLGNHTFGLGNAATCNLVVNSRQGPYGYNTWRQIRVGQGKLARYYRENNILSHTQNTAEPIVVSRGSDNGTTTVPVRFGSTITSSRAPLDESQHPLLYKLAVQAGETNDGVPIMQETMLKSSYGNKLLFFSDVQFNEAVGVKAQFSDPAYRELLNVYGKKRKDDSTAPVEFLVSLEYTETIYPAKKNSYKSEIRGRTAYENNFWRDARADRTTKGASKKPRNSANATLPDQSAWSLDAQENFTTFTHTPSTFPAGASGRAVNNASGHIPGELQNEYVHVHAGTASQASPGILYARKQVYPATGAIAPRWGMEIKEMTSSAGSGYEDYALIPTASLFRGEALWEAASTAGQYEGTSSVFTSASTSGNPFYDSYDSFIADIRSKGKGYSIIPEYRITDHLSYYKNNQDDFLIENQKLFTVVGTPTGSTVPQNSSEDNFYSVFSTSDFLKYFEIIRKDHEGIVDPHTIKMKCKAIKKFVPYDGFYPSERTIQMANQFVTDYSGSLNRFAVNTSDGASLRAFLKPLFAPGILYNTIKAGVAVDYPTLRANATPSIADGVVDQPKRGSTYDPQGIAIYAPSASYFTSSFAIFSSTHTASVLATDFIHDHFDGWDKRIPFEALADPEGHLANVRIGDDEPSDYAQLQCAITWDGTGGTRYRKMMNNFLVENINFFLKNGELSKIESLPQSQFKSVKPGQPYGMRIKMFRSQENAKLSSGSWGNFEVPQNVPVIVANGATNPFTGETNDTGAEVDATPRETFTMYSRPAAFGPPIGLYRSGSFDQWTATGRDRWPGTIYDFTPSNGIYGSHTPPYYDGESWFDIIFWPRGLETQFVPTPPHLFKYQGAEDGMAYKPTLEEIFATPSEQLFKVSGSATDTDALSFSATQIPLAGSFTRKWRYDQESLRYISNSSYHVNSASVPTNGHIVRIGPAAGPFMNQWAMHLDSCLNIFNKDLNVDLPDSDRKWSIRTKFETPMLNFNHVTSSNGTMTVTDDPKANVAIPRGMWHQFGRLPQDEEGVVIQVTDIPSQWLSTHPSTSLVPDIAGQSSARNKSPYVNNSTEAKTYYNGYSVPVGSGSSYQIPTVQSLVDVCGFDTTPVRLGKVRSKRTLFEAVVAVPFRLVDGERRFYETFNINAPETEVSGLSYRNLVAAQGRYVFPATFDFVNNPSVTPVAMYVFEFKQEFDTNDLSKIWQNVAPKIATEAVSSYSTVSHELLASELMSDIEETAKSQFFNTPMPYIDLDKEIQWMVFKVKQRAGRDYFTKSLRHAPKMPFYTDNWPYDFCSLVELAKIDTSIQFKKIGAERRIGHKTLTAAEAAAFAARGAAGSDSTAGTIVQRATFLDADLHGPGDWRPSKYFGSQTQRATSDDDGADTPTYGPGEILTQDGTVDAYSGVDSEVVSKAFVTTEGAGDDALGDSSLDSINTNKLSN